MGSISTWGGGSPSKSTLKSYVHDAAELEFSLFRLQESRKKLKEKLDEAKREDPTACIRHPHYENEIIPSIHLISYRTPNAEEEKRIVQKNRVENPLDYWGGYQGNLMKGFSFREIWTNGVYGWLGIILSFCVGGIILYATKDSTGGQLVASLVALGGMIASFFIAKKKAKDKKENHNKKQDEKVIQRYRQEIQDYNEDARRKNEAEERRYAAECARANSENPSIRERNAQRRKDYEAACAKARVPHDRKIAMLEAQLSELESAITRTTQDRERFYSVNIVPVDYRTIQCVFYLDHAFRNDLVDTVRQGIDRYELSEYRTAVLGGIYSIVSKLDQMTGLMRDLGHQLSSIQSEVSFMSNDLYNMAEEQSRKQTEIGNRILEESRLRRKVTEELNENAERIARYCDSR